MIKPSFMYEIKIHMIPVVIKNCCYFQNELPNNSKYFLLVKLSHMYRSGQTMQYYLTPQPPPPPPPPVVNTENPSYCTYDGQYMQYCDSIQTSDVPVPQVVSNPVYLSTVKAPAASNPNPVYHPTASSKPVKTEEKPHKKRNKMTYRSNNSSPTEGTCFVDEGGSGDATGSHQTVQGDYCQNYSETEDNYNSNTVYYVVPNSEPVQTNYVQSNYVVDNNYVLDPSQSQSVYYGNPQNVSMKISNQQQVYPKNNAIYYPVPQNAFGTVIGQNPPYPTPSYGAYVHQNAAMYLNNPFGNVPNSSYFLSVDNNYGSQGEQKDSTCWNQSMGTEERRSKSAKTNVKVKNVTPCKHKSTSTKEVTKDMKNLKL
ncbi:hypothetical protein Phum_PHUM575400 [Pediculus humanus corporis]|uniref:Uncharacterized protein n=1 Tax=Pediculus humanus subsp. corporis TaxID=121224 RepID=E0W1E2_PEDHC|nr:uncharacterized protein Phum_PHUM575400 [Pediculus humanus corporis]EEB19448.1 hypothetical protein Phum_PHUM575400 [Pediculus humanus corporis]